MQHNSHVDHIHAFRTLHTTGSPLVLPNVWDVASARLVARAGAAAIATTSAGVAWSLGAADGDRLDRDRAIDLVGRIVAAVDLPVTADIESGYAADAAGVAETVARVLAAGAAGINLEDGTSDPARPLRPVAEQVTRIAAARRAADRAGVPLFVNARTDVHLRAVGEPAGRLAETARRAETYLTAGADGIFVPGVADPDTISALVGAVGPAPLNVLVGPGSPAVAELAALGVARISAGSSIAQAAYAVVRNAAAELLGIGRYGPLTDAVDYGELNALLTDGSPG
jgi:2-methylisocitrate lyase-like PEP mutase family enzyme